MCVGLVLEVTEGLKVVNPGRVDSQVEEVFVRTAQERSRSRDAHEAMTDKRPRRPT